jgi:hypothetical protein
MSETPLTFAPAPTLGEQTRPVLADAGISEPDLQSMREEGVL